jgi:hypothetical protein
MCNIAVLTVQWAVKLIGPVWSIVCSYRPCVHMMVIRERRRGERVSTANAIEREQVAAVG